MSLSPNFASSVRVGFNQITTANANRDGSGAVTSILAAGTNGTRIDSIVVKATSNTTVGMVRLFVNDGTTTRLWREVSIIAITASASNPTFFLELLASDTTLPLLLLPAGYSLLASTNNSETFNVIASGGDF